MPFFPNLRNAFIYDESSQDAIIGGQTNVYSYLTVSNNSFVNGYQTGLGNCTGDEFTESLFLAVISQIIQDLCKSL